MIRVANGKIIRKLSDRSLRANQLRNAIAVFAIILTAILFTTLLTLGIGTVENFQRATMRQSGGDGHAVLKYITDEDFNRIKGHRLIREIAYNRSLSDGVENPEFRKRRAELWYMDDTGMRFGFCEPTNGHKPLAENEIITDTKTLKLLGVPQKAGASLQLRLNIRGREVVRDFVLSGWWESDPAFPVGILVTSRAYMDAHAEELQNTYREDRSMTGTINAYIKFRSSIGMKENLYRVILESGYSTEESSPNYLEHNVNWAYLSSGFRPDPATMFALLCGLLLVVFTGYLIIYNIFHISVIRDIQFYGLLKTVGTTGRQIRRIIRRQALVLSLAGIPAGLAVGFFIGKSFVPYIISQSSYAGSIVSVSPSPWIFACSAAFLFATVLISVYKPGMIAASVSPVEAVRYTEGLTNRTGRTKRTQNGGKTFRMAFSNLGRGKKRTVLAVLSLSLSLVLLNTVFTLSRGIDLDKYLSKFVDTDFLLAHADYFRDDFSGPRNETTESFIQAVESRPGFEEGGRLYGGREQMFSTEDPKNGQRQYVDEKGNFFTVVYGLENLPMKRLELIDGEMDPEKLSSGKYILEGVYLDDYGVPEMNGAHYSVGETVILHTRKGTSEKPADREYTTQTFQVLGHVAVKTFSNSDRVKWDYTFYLPAGVYKGLVARPAVMSYACNVRDEYETEMEKFLQKYTDAVEPSMNYTSKLTSLNEFKGMRSMVVMIGGALSLIIGLVGILNFSNSVLTGILARRREFAVLEGIGMTRRQLNSMLCFEGLYYAVGTSALSVALGALFSLLVVRPLCSQLWFFSYQFLLWPVLTVLPVLFLLGVLIPIFSHSVLGRQSVVDRLRLSE